MGEGGERWEKGREGEQGLAYKLKKKMKVKVHNMPWETKQKEDPKYPPGSL